MATGLLQNIVSFGAAGRIDDATTELLAIQRAYEARLVAFESRRADVAAVLERLVEAKVAAYDSLSRIRTLTDSLSIRERQFIADEPPVGGVRADLGSVAKSLSAGDVALSALKGGSAAVSTAAGAWALVGAVGTASTGTSIAALSGAAATNATLAWFGGGAVAAGGGGMAGGALVLGGIVAVPAVILMATFTHVAAGRKIEEIKAHGVRVLAERDKCEQSLIVLDATAARADELIASIQVARRAFEHVFMQVAARLRLRWHQRLWRAIRMWFGGPRYAAFEIAAIAEVAAAATAFARVIDQPIFDENGVPT